MRVHGLVATTLFAFLAASLRAQVPTFEAATDVVHVWVSVRDSKGKPVTNLTRDAFRLLDEGKPRNIELFGRQGEEGWKALNEVDVALALDSSQRMLLDITQARAAALAFIEKLPPNIALFDGSPRSATVVATDRAMPREWLDKRPTMGASALYDGFARTLQRMEPSTRRRVFVALTDGFDERSAISLSAFTQELRRVGATFYGVQFTGGFSSKRMYERTAAHAALRALADATGGLVLSADTVPPQSLLDEILADIASQYVLGFAPGRDDAFHRLRVTVTRGGVKTRHRDGYYPPPSR